MPHQRVPLHLHALRSAPSAGSQASLRDACTHLRHSPAHHRISLGELELPARALQLPPLGAVLGGDGVHGPVARTDGQAHASRGRESKRAGSHQMSMSLYRSPAFCSTGASSAVPTHSGGVHELATARSGGWAAQAMRERQQQQQLLQQRTLAPAWSCGVHSWCQGTGSALGAGSSLGAGSAVSRHATGSCLDSALPRSCAFGSLRDQRQSVAGAGSSSAAAAQRGALAVRKRAMGTRNGNGSQVLHRHRALQRRAQVGRAAWQRGGAAGRLARWKTWQWWQRGAAKWPQPLQRRAWWRRSSWCCRTLPSTARARAPARPVSAGQAAQQGAAQRNTNLGADECQVRRDQLRPARRITLHHRVVHTHLHPAPSRAACDAALATQTRTACPLGSVTVAAMHAPMLWCAP